MKQTSYFAVSNEYHYSTDFDVERLMKMETQISFEAFTDSRIYEGCSLINNIISYTLQLYCWPEELQKLEEFDLDFI